MGDALHTCACSPMPERPATFKGTYLQIDKMLIHLPPVEVPAILHKTQTILLGLQKTPNYVLSHICRLKARLCPSWPLEPKGSTLPPAPLAGLNPLKPERVAGRRLAEMTNEAAGIGLQS